MKVLSSKRNMKNDLGMRTAQLRQDILERCEDVLKLGNNEEVDRDLNRPEFGVLNLKPLS